MTFMNLATILAITHLSPSSTTVSALSLTHTHTHIHTSLLGATSPFHLYIPHNILPPEHACYPTIFTSKGPARPPPFPYSIPSSIPTPSSRPFSLLLTVKKTSAGRVDKPHRTSVRQFPQADGTSCMSHEMRQGVVLGKQADNQLERQMDG